jgi:hypothetical protein
MPLYGKGVKARFVKEINGRRYLFNYEAFDTLLKVRRLS